MNPLQRLLHLRLSLHGVNLEKALNAARKEGIILKKVRRMEDLSLRCQCKKADAGRLRGVCERFSCRMDVLPAPFLSWQILRIQRSKAFLFGIALFLALIPLSMQHIWGIRLVDAGAYAGDIRACLQEWGVEPGMKKSDLSPTQLQQQLEWRYPQVAWVRVDYQGVFLRITLVEGVPTPEVASWGRAGDVVASQDALVESIVTLSGTPLVSPGDFVRAGQVLIEGTERTGAEQTAPVKARGQITGRVWIEAEVTTSAYETITTPTGNRASRRILATPWIAWSRMDSPDFTQYDKASAYHVLGGAWAPVYLIREDYEEIALEKKPRDETALRQEIARAAGQILQSRLQKGDVLVDKWVDYSMIDVDRCVAVAVAEVRRDIGRFAADGASPVQGDLSTQNKQ